MLVLLTKRKLRPDGCQTVKPPGILAMPNIFSPPFFSRKLLRQVQDFMRVPRILAFSQTNIPNPLKFILEILFPAVLLFLWCFHLTLSFHCTTWVSHWSSTLLTLTHVVCRPYSIGEPPRPKVKAWPWPLLAPPSPLQPPTLPGWDKQFPLQAESYRVNLPGVLQELLPTSWAVISG